MTKGQTWNVSFRNFIKYLEVIGLFKIGITNTFKAYISGSHKTYVDDFEVDIDLDENQDWWIQNGRMV